MSQLLYASVSSITSCLHLLLKHAYVSSCHAQGRNTEQQCGIEGNQPVVTQPTAVLELLQQPITSIAAGRNNSAAVVRNSDVYTWGEGLCGKLGLGSGAASAPSRVSKRLATAAAYMSC
jgi:alpha-tubulin suppressor-like RCC1 family protein